MRDVQVWPYMRVYNPHAHIFVPPLSESEANPSQPPEQKREPVSSSVLEQF
jgi:hypothetical protein